MRRRSESRGDPGPAGPPPGSGGGRSGDGAAGSEFAGLGIAMGLAIALFAVAGNWLDGRLGTRPLFVLIGVFVGFGGGFYSMYARLVLSRRQDDAD